MITQSDIRTIALEPAEDGGFDWVVCIMTADEYDYDLVEPDCD